MSPASVLACAVLAGGLVGCGGPNTAAIYSDTPAATEAAATITPADMAARIGVLAHDSMRGRATPSPELDAASRWIGAEFAALGLEASFGDSFEQRYAIRTVTANQETTWLTAGGPDTLRSPDNVGLPFGPAADDRVREGGVVFVGIKAEVSDETLAGNHVLVVGDAASAFRTQDAFTLLGRLRTSGAVAVWQVSRTGQSVAAWRRSNDLQTMQARTVVGAQPNEVPVLSVRLAGLQQVLGQGVLEAGLAVAEGASIELPDVSFAARTGLSVISSEEAPNAAAVLHGSDPSLRDQFVVYSAHMDHVGVGRPDATGDSIFNGADDDASGTAAVLEIAEAFASMPTPPKRSIIFLLVSGEERGLWGSEYFANNSPVPVESMVANLNADMVGRNWSDTIVAIGKEHSELGPLLEAVNARHPELGMTAIDDIWPDENFYGRSDHFNFARKGVPILFFFNGVHDDYHQPSDEVELIDTDKAARIATLMFRLGVEVANREAPPEWNEASRRRIVQPDLR